MESVQRKTRSGNKVFIVKFKDGETPFSHETEGLCIACGEFKDGVEPDARQYHCDNCNENKVYGIEELVLMGYAIPGTRKSVFGEEK